MTVLAMGQRTADGRIRGVDRGVRGQVLLSGAARASLCSANIACCRSGAVLSGCSPSSAREHERASAPARAEAGPQGGRVAGGEGGAEGLADRRVAGARDATHPQPRAHAQLPQLDRGARYTLSRAGSASVDNLCAMPVRIT